MEWIKGIADVLKLGPRYLFAGMVLAGGALFLPTTVHKKLGLSDWIVAYRSWVGLVFAVCAVLTALSALLWLWRRLRLAWETKQERTAIVERLQKLTEPEKQILRYYFAKNTRSNFLRHQDGVVAGLAAIGVIYLASRTGTLTEGFAYNISDYAWKIIREKPHVLLGETNFYRCDKPDSPWGF
ncbi:super-infection exclusion protein B [Xanthomonas sacchari]|uniref:super-infection exclusion protein B n=1 Tax=unclassified Xanthomonas TaxID=2643310 RepID=UPI000380B34E|nr:MULTISPECIES: super-infection exclusion protein B [unclassified Xanthomonas]KAB7765723.1 hypothetical protein CEK69_16875 [Xanthomonas sp. LMG 12462]